MATIQGVYLALFGRPADPLGLAFFNTATNNGQNLSTIGNLAGTAEYQGRFTGQSNVQIINSIYQSLFNRDADVAGLTFFANQLSSGRQTINTIAINILDGATGTDKAIIDAKEAAANRFTAAIDTTAEIVAYSGTAAADAGRTFISGVTTTAPTDAAINTAIANIVATPPTQSTIALTTGADAPAGTAGNDTFVGIAGAGATYSAADVINGGAGTDTLRLVTDGNVTVFGSNLTSIEAISVTNSATAAVTLTGVTGVTSLDVNGGTGGITFTDAGTVGALSVRNTAQATTVTYTDAAVAGTADTLALTVGAVTGGAAINLNSATGNAVGVDTVNLNGVNAASNISLTSNDSSISTVNFSGSQNLTVALGAGVTTSATTLNASALTGNLTLSGLGAATHVVTGGSGADTVLFGANFTTADTFNGGAGVDTLGANAAQLAAVTARAATVTNVETVFIENDAAADATINLANFGATNVRIGAQSAGEDIIVNGLTSGANVRFDGAVAAAAADLVLNVTNATNPGTADALTFDLRGGAVTYNATVAGVETLNFDASNATGNSVLGFTAAAATTVNIVNSGTFTVDTGTLGTLVSTVNASGVTGTAGVTVSLSGAAITGATVTGTANADVVNGSQLLDIINSGAGNDTITAGAGADRINVGAGTDTLVQGLAASGTFAAPVANSISTTTFDIVTGTAAGDRIDLTDVARTLNAAASTVVGVAPADNTATFVRGTYDATANTFVGSATGADSLFVYDADAGAGVALEATVLVGFVNTATAAAGGDGIFTLA